jgi:hypothetical protein
MCGGQDDRGLRNDGLMLSLMVGERSVCVLSETMLSYEMILSLEAIWGYCYIDFLPLLWFVSAHTEGTNKRA